MEQKKPILSNIDLNLLRTFRVLYRERNTRRTAEIQNVTQPAISQTLQKLRNLFDDELFVKVPKGLEPTPFAERLEKAINIHMNGLEQALGQLYEFEPSELTGSLRIALSHIVMPSIAGSLYNEFQSLAPKLKLELISWSQSTPSLLQSGDVFYGVHYDLDTLSKQIARDVLAQVQGSVIVRKTHPIPSSSIGLAEAAKYKIASHIAPGWNDNFVFAQQILESEGYNAEIGFRSEDLLALIDVVESSDMILPQSTLFPIEKFPSLKLLPVSLPHGDLSFDLFGYVHNKNRNSAMAKWVEGVITKEIQNVLNKRY